MTEVDLNVLAIDEIYRLLDVKLEEVFETELVVLRAHKAFTARPQPGGMPIVLFQSVVHGFTIAAKLRSDLALHSIEWSRLTPSQIMAQVEQERAYLQLIYNWIVQLKQQQEELLTYIGGKGADDA